MTEATSTRLPGTSVAEAHLINAGFRPSRHSRTVRLVRRVLWPLIRPFHFHLLREVEDLRSDVAADGGRIAALEGRPQVVLSDSRRYDAVLLRLDALEHGLCAATDGFGPAIDRLGAAIDRLESEFQAAANRLDELRRDTARVGDIERLVLAHTRQRSELVALSNRHGWVEERVRQVVGSVGALEASSKEHVTRLDALTSDTQTAGFALGSQQERLDQAAQWLAQLTTDASSTNLRVSALEGRCDEHAELLGPSGVSKAVGERLDAVEADLWAQHHDALFLAPTAHGVFLLKAGELISDFVRQHGVWDAHILDAAERALAVLRARADAPAQLRAVDVGAHFGLLSVAFGRMFDRVTSFEPNVFNASLLRANVMLNGLAGQVDVRRAALSRSRESLSLAPTASQEIPLPLDADGGFAPMTANNLGAYSFVADGTGISEAEAYPLDSLELDDLGFMKIDVQGADGLVLLGAMETIARCRPWLVFEWEEALSQRFGVTFDQVEERLASVGYTIAVLHRHNQKQVDYLAAPTEEAHALPPAAVGQDE